MALAMCHVTHCDASMIKTFKDSDTEDLFSGEHVSRFPADVQSRVRRKLFAIDAAMRIEDLRMPPGITCIRSRGTEKGSTRYA